MFQKNDVKMSFQRANRIKKKIFRDVFVKQWCNTLIKRFKKRVVIALKNLQNERYIFVDVRNDRTSRVYVQNVFRHIKVANYFFTYHQFFNVWSNFELVLRKQIFEFISNTILTKFFVVLDVKISIFEIMMIFKRFDNFNNVDNKSNRFMNKQNRERQNDFSQQFVVYDFQFF